MKLVVNVPSSKTRRTYYYRVVIIAERRVDINVIGFSSRCSTGK